MGLTALTARSEAQTVSGIIGLERCAAPAQPVTFAFSSATQTYFFTRAVTLNANGSYALPNLPADRYHVRVKGAKWLAAVSDVDTRNGNATLNAALLAGDTNDDNSVDSSDFTTLFGAYNSSASIPGSGYDPNADLNCDGLVDSSDFTLLIGNYNATGNELPAGTPRPLPFAQSVSFTPCLLYADAVREVASELTDRVSFAYTSRQPETARFENDFTPNAMQTHLVLATRNKAHICIYNAPAIVQPATVLTAPGTVMYDAVMLPAPSGPSSDPYNGVANVLHTLNVTLTAGTTYHIVIEYDNTGSFETTPNYAASYGLNPTQTIGFNGVTLYPLCAAPPTKTGCSWDVLTPIQCKGIVSATSGSQTWPYANAGVPSFPTITVMPGSVVTLTSDTATDDDQETITYSDGTSTMMKVADSVTYAWSVNGGMPTTGSAQTFTWTAPMTPGHYTVTLTVNDGNDTNKGDCTGTRDDPALTFTFDIWVCNHAHPTNYHQTLGKDLGDGTLYFEYAYESTSGVLGDLSMCTVNEIVTYPGGGMPIRSLTAPPWAADWNQDNPTISPPDNSGHGDRGTGADLHSHRSFTKPYSAASFHAIQYYRYHCPGCMAANEFQNLVGPTDIFCQIILDFKNQEWDYKITKNGITSTYVLP